MMQHNDDCAREPVQYLSVPRFTPSHPAEPVESGVPEKQEHPETPEEQGSCSLIPYSGTGKGATILALSVVIPLGVLICYRPVVGLVLLVSVGLYLINQYIDQKAEKWGGK